MSDAGSPAVGEGCGPSETHSVECCRRCSYLEAQVERLTRTVRDQAKALAELTDECPPWAPSVAIVYWRYSLVRCGEKSWHAVWNRTVPLVNALGDLKAQKLTSSVWAEHRAQRSRTPTRNGTPPCDHTLNIELHRAKEMLRWAVDQGMIKYNPLQPAKGVKTRSQRETSLSSEVVDRMLHHADDVIDGRLKVGDDDGLRARTLRAFVLCCYDSMLRFEEARALRRDQIGPSGEITFRGKGDKQRTVVLTERTRKALAALPRHPSTQLLFIRHDGARVSTGALRWWFRGLCRIAGVDQLAAPRDRRIVPHILRASGATEADRRGVRSTALRDFLGHSNLKTTEIYLRSGALENARHVGEIMGQRAPPKRVARKVGRRAVHESAERK